MIPLRLETIQYTDFFAVTFGSKRLYNDLFLAPPPHPIQIYDVNVGMWRCAFNTLYPNLYRTGTRTRRNPLDTS